MKRSRSQRAQAPRKVTTLFELVASAQRCGLEDHEVVEVIGRLLSAHRCYMGAARIELEPCDGLQESAPA